MTPRLTAAMLVSALVRRTHQQGGHAAVLAKGDDAGAVLVVCAERGRRTAILERLLDGQARYRWQSVGPDPTAPDDDAAAWLERRRARDPDLWIVELDIAEAQRFVAETTADD